MAGPIGDLVLLRGLFTDTALRPGVVLAARVLEREGPRGTLLLNGARVAAQLPPGLAAGDVLRVRVQEVSTERLALQVIPRPDSSSPAPVPTIGLPLPGGAHLRVDPDPPAAGGDPASPARRSIAVRFDSPALGRIDFLIDLDPDAVTTTVGVAAGAADRARSAANDLREGLESATGRPATVTIDPRAEELDVRA